EGQRANVQTQTDLIERSTLENERALGAIDARISVLKETLTRLPEYLAEETSGPNSSADSLRTELYRVQIQEKEASSRYTEKHPTVIALRQQVADTKKIFDEQEPRRTQSTERLNPTHVTLRSELNTAEALAAAHRAEAK